MPGTRYAPASREVKRTDAPRAGGSFVKEKERSSPERIRKGGISRRERELISRVKDKRSDWQDRCSAMREIVQKKMESGFFALIDSLGDSEEITRWYAAWALGDAGDRRAIPALRRAAKKDPSSIVREKAAESLGRLGGNYVQ